MNQWTHCSFIGALLRDYFVGVTLPTARFVIMRIKYTIYGILPYT